MHFIDPKNDYAFKRIFGNENKPNILISFLNSMLHLSGETAIKQVTLLNPNQAPRLKETKETILDVRCQNEQGAEYIVEMQVLKQEFFDKRVLYYAAKAYSQQLGSGERYNQLVPVTFLGILDFKFTEDPHYISTHTIHNIETKEHVLTDFRFTFAELPKFVKTEQQLKTIEDKWLYFLKHASTLESVPTRIQDQALHDAFEIANQSNWSKEELEYYERRNIAVTDETLRVLHGYKKGHKTGHTEGRTEGRAEGRTEKSKEIAKNLLASDFSPTDIAKITELSIPEIESIKIKETVS